MGLWASILGNVLLFCLVLGMSATVDIRSIHTQVRNIRALSTGLFCQFLVLPFLGFLVVRFMELEESLGLTLLVVTSSPGGSYSNWWCNLFNADLALSVTMTALSTVLSMVFLPLNLLFYTKMAYNKQEDDDLVANLDWSSLFTSLAIVMCAILLGLTLSAKVHNVRFQHFANGLGNAAGLMLIIFSATMTNTGDSDSKIWSRNWSFYVAVSGPCLGGLILANILATLAQLPKPERVTVAIECCYQNVGIATSLALTMFQGEDLNVAMGVPFFYGVVEALFVGIFCLGAWKFGWTKAPANASLCDVLFISYELLELEAQAAAAKDVDGSSSNPNTKGGGGTIEVVDSNKTSQKQQKDKEDYVLMDDDNRSATSDTKKPSVSTPPPTATTKTSTTTPKDTKKKKRWARKGLLDDSIQNDSNV
ncbi:hypothetical protein ACA910_021273 [Epithemia clementina (nom. ined.)]